MVSTMEDGGVIRGHKWFIVDGESDDERWEPLDSCVDADVVVKRQKGLLAFILAST